MKREDAGTRILNYRMYCGFTELFPIHAVMLSRSNKNNNSNNIMGRTYSRQEKRIAVLEPALFSRPQSEVVGDNERVNRGGESEDVDNDHNEEDDQIMSQIEDSGSIPTTMGVRVSLLEKGRGTSNEFSCFRFPLHRAPSREFREFVIPQTPAAIAAAAAEAVARNSSQDMQQDDDDISVLTEFSGMEEEEDATSQVTAGTEARTVVTTTTGSTTVPTRNAGQMDSFCPTEQKKLIKRRNGAVDKNHGLPPMDNSQYKRRRMR